MPPMTGMASIDWIDPRLRPILSMSGGVAAPVLEDHIMNMNAGDFDALFELLCEVCAEYAQSH
ncbi:MAG: hypothetical protein PWP40_1319 [Rhodocyclaceae bacterium]|nr:hypothetical protein [Rhodocyclaceae bacterium]